MTRAFLAFVGRDLSKDLRTLPSIAADLFLQPALFLFVFGVVLPRIGSLSSEYLQVLVPGLIVMTALSSAFSGMCVPTLVELHYTRELEDRLLAPVPLALVPLAKLVRCAIRSLLGAFVFAVAARLVVGFDPLDGGLLLLVASLAAAAAGAGLGLLVSTKVTVENIDAVASLTVSILMFTGCAQYSWNDLGSLRIFQWMTLANPMTYASEMARSNLYDGLSPILSGAVLSAVTVVTWTWSCQRFKAMVTG